MTLLRTTEAIAEFHNTCHHKSNGKFCNTAGTGNVGKNPAAIKAAQLRDKKNGIGPDPKPKKATASKKVAASKPKAAPKKAAPVSKSASPKKGWPAATSKNPLIDWDSSGDKKAKSKKAAEIVKGAVKSGTKIKDSSITKASKPPTLDKNLADVLKQAKSSKKPPPSMPDMTTDQESDQSASGGRKAQRERIKRIAETDLDGVLSEKLKKSDPFNGEAVGLNELPPPKGLKETKLSDDEIGALMTYRGNNYAGINGALRLGVAGAVPKGKFTKVIEDMDSAFKNAPETDEDIVVYRGTEQSIKGSTINDKGFISTSYDRTTANGFAREHGEVLTIRIPKGSKILKLSGKNPGESEILLPRGSTFKKDPKTGEWILQS